MRPWVNRFSPGPKAGFEYGYGGTFRDPNQTNMGNGILKVNANFVTGGERTVLRIISIHVDDLLISGSSEFPEYVSLMAKAIRGRYLWGE